jgi:hypothetical protein
VCVCVSKLESEGERKGEGEMKGGE